jgi:hypothetical protein
MLITFLGDGADRHGLDRRPRGRRGYGGDVASVLREIVAARWLAQLRPWQRPMPMRRRAARRWY